MRSTTDYFLGNLQFYTENTETGRLDIKNISRPQYSWSLYLSLGRLFWISSGTHQQRSIYRQLKKRYPEQLNSLLQLFSEVSQKSEATYYGFLVDLFRQQKLTIEEFISIKETVMVDALFDIQQIDYIQQQASSDYSTNSGLQWSWSPNIRPKKYIPIPRESAQSTKSLVKQAQQTWQTWSQAGLTHCLPNQAPIMTQPEQIQQATAEKTFQNLKRLLTGKESLRDIALATKRDLLPITKALWVYYKKGWLQFQEIPDLNWNPLTQPNQSDKTTINATSKNPKFLIACVDDSPQVTQTVEQIVRGNGYDFIGINDPLRANATLLKVKPDLIFLDLIMPTTNGYEICTQLRRVSSLQETPIIILTGKDGLIDRMRAKMVGSTQYISKPVERNTILETVRKYLQGSEKKSSVNSHLYSATAEA